jgi:hypothetical protein
LFNPNRGQAPTPNLREIRISTPGIPYLGTTLFRNIRQIHINAESVQLPERFTLPVLEEFHATCNTFGTETGTEIIAFLNRHGKLQQLCLTIRSTLGPLTESFLDMTETVLKTNASEELVASIVENAKGDARNESRFFLKSVHRQMTERLDAELVKNLNQEFVSVFRLGMAWKRKAYYGTLKEIRSTVQNR